MNRLVLAYVTQLAVGTENFTCVARRIASACDCGWSKRVGDFSTLSKMDLIKKLQFQARIYNGVDAQMHEFPSAIAIVAISINRVFCGGVIISEKWGLTGAHCFNEPEYSNLNNIVAFVGEHDLTTPNETMYTESHEIEMFVKHEGYDKDDYLQNNDIALIKMKESIAFNRAVGPACLPWHFEQG